MNLEYLVKKCQGFGYATKLTDVKLKELGEDCKQIYFLRDVNTHGKPKGTTQTFTNINDFEDYFSKSDSSTVDFTQPTLFFVEVGVPTVQTNNIDVDIEDEVINKIIDDFEIPEEIDINDEQKQMYKNCLKDFKRQPDTYMKAEFNPTFLKFLEDIYPEINDTKLQRIILKILIKNNIRVDTILKTHPMNYQTEEVDTVKLSSIFSDIKVNDPFFEKSKETLEDENTNGILKAFSSQAIAKFNGFGNTFAQVDNNKKRANLKEINTLRNHAVIHALARNKIVCSPASEKPLSLQILMDVMSKFERFHVIFIYPNYQNGFRYNSVPNKIMEIDPSNGNVILNVVFRYMCLNFFGMHETINHEDLRAKYML